MKKLLKPTLLIAFSFAFGFITMGYLSMRASSFFLEDLRHNYDMEQRIMAIRAKRNGNINQAVIHYSNLVSVSSSPGIYSFSSTREHWTMFFPISSLMIEKLILENIINTTQKKKVTKKANKMQEGLYRGMLADALEKAGRTEEAMLEYIKSSRLLDYGDDITKGKKFVNEIMLIDDDFLKLQDHFVYPQKNKVPQP